MITFAKIDAGEINAALMAGHDEIIRLRARVAELGPKAEAYDTIQRLAALTVQHDQRGMGIDPAWSIKSLLERAHRDGKDEQAA